MGNCPTVMGLKDNNLNVYSRLIYILKLNLSRLQA